ncbi:MAG: hypothetical protein VXW38_05285 [Bacteroidota bacterium]|nr:hypothetical protein [Bacteroidota bacterium]
MTTGISLLIFIAFYLLYSTSKKMAALDSFGVETWLGEHTKASKYTALALLTLSLGLSCFYWGMGSGAFTFFIIIMTVASLIILLAPLRLLTYTSLACALVLSLLFEIILF